MVDWSGFFNVESGDGVALNVGVGGGGRMAKLIIASPDGEVLDEMDVVGDEQVGSQVATWVSTRPGLPIYINGRLLSDELRRKILHAIAQSAAQRDLGVEGATPHRAHHAPVGPITPDEFTTFNQLLGQAAAGLLHTQQEILRQAQASTQWQLDNLKMGSAAMLERDRLAADEAARQRKLTHQSLRDIDLLDRSVKVQELTDAFQTVTKRGLAANARMSPREPSPVMDWVHAIATVVHGPRSGAPGPNEPKPGESK